MLFRSRQKGRTPKTRTDSSLEPSIDSSKPDALTTQPTEEIQRSIVVESEEETTEVTDCLPSFEGISAQEIKTISFKHAEKLTSELLEKYDLTDDVSLFEEILKSIKKVITEYRDEARSKT